MDIMKEIEKFISMLEKGIADHMKEMDIPCARFILIDSCLWTLFIIYYIVHFFIAKQYKTFEKGHKGYELLLQEKDIIIITFLLLAVLLYFYFIVLKR